MAGDERHLYGLLEQSSRAYAAAPCSAAATLAVATPADVPVLQTNASIENVAIAAYKLAIALPFVGGSEAIPFLRTFARRTLTQHAQHARAYNAAIVRLGGEPQHEPDPVIYRALLAAEPNLATPGSFIALAIELENSAAATYVRAVATLSDIDARNVTAGIMGVEAQHEAILRTLQELVQAGDAAMIQQPPPVAGLPAAAGNAGFPNALYPTTAARPPAEGAVSP
jgi:hypothetical protein